MNPTCQPDQQARQPPESSFALNHPPRTTLTLCRRFRQAHYGIFHPQQRLHLRQEVAQVVGGKAAHLGKGAKHEAVRVQGLGVKEGAVVVTGLPRNAMGKVQKSVLRKTMPNNVWHGHTRVLHRFFRALSV